MQAWPASSVATLRPVYNLLVNFLDGTADRTRVVEHTEDAVLQYVAPDGAVDPARLVHLPTLIMPERGNKLAPQLARVGHIEDLIVSPRSYRFRFVQNTAMKRSLRAELKNLRTALGLQNGSSSGRTGR